MKPYHVVSTMKTDSNRTPKTFFDYIQKTFKVKFKIDVAADKKNALCKRFIDKEKDTLNSDWTKLAWCNPPYSLAREFVERCYDNSLAGKASTFMLLAARTDRDWWHDCAKHAKYIVYIKGRIKFSNAKAGAPFPSVILVFKKNFIGPTKNIYLQPTPYERGFKRGKPDADTIST